MNSLVQPSYSFSIPSVPTAVSVALTTLAPTAQRRCPACLAPLAIRQASALMCISSESILCFVRSSTSMSWKLPNPQCRVMKAFLIPLISIIFIICSEKWMFVPGAETAPSFFAKTDWNCSISSAVACANSSPSFFGRLSMM